MCQEFDAEMQRLASLPPAEREAEIARHREEAERSARQLSNMFTTVPEYHDMEYGFVNGVLSRPNMANGVGPLMPVLIIVSFVYIIFGAALLQPRLAEETLGCVAWIIVGFASILLLCGAVCCDGWSFLISGRPCCTWSGCQCFYFKFMLPSHTLISTLMAITETIWRRDDVVIGYWWGLCVITSSVVIVLIHMHRYGWGRSWCAWIKWEDFQVLRPAQTRLNQRLLDEPVAV